LVQNSGLTLGERGAAIVDDHLHSIDHREVFVIGDNAVVRHPRTQEVAIPCGQLAAQQGEYVARQISAELRGKSERPYVPHFDGLLISLGSYAGVGTAGPVWVREQIARALKTAAETRYLYNIGGMPLLLARGLQLRHEFVTVSRLLKATATRPSGTGQGGAVV
jgi:NADH dehydrogenase